MTKILSLVHGLVWGAPALCGILGVGIWFSVRTKLAQVTLFPESCRLFFRRLLGSQTRGTGVPPFQALCTALAATVGTGNLVGVAGAICIGGPGAILWMWVCGVLGMIIKCAEVTLAVHYRRKRKDGFVGGPMYIIRDGMGSRWLWLGKCYAFLGVIAAFGVGNATQINAVVGGLNRVLPELTGSAELRRNLGLGLILAVLAGCVLLGGAKRIGQAAELLVPFASLAYIALCLVALGRNAAEIPAALGAIFRGAFSPKSVTGGVVGSGFLALRTGCARGVFTNEAGMGTASMAHASASADHPVEQGLMGVMEVFADTIVICTLTALVILTSGISIPYGVDAGAAVTDRAFRAVFGSGASVFLTGALCCFAFATVLGWGLYGLRCAQFLFGDRISFGFALVQTLAVIPGAVLPTGTVWLAAEILNGLMVIPNLWMLAALAPQFFRLIQEYKGKSGTFASGG